jgi:hypothetical protein
MARRSLASRLFATIAFSGLAVGWPTQAQTSADPQAERLRILEQRLDASQKLIEKLSERIAELERAAAQARPKPDGATPSSAEQAKEIAALRESVDQISDGLSRNISHTGVPLHGFADAGAGWSSREDPTRLRGFNVGTFDVYLTPQFGDRVKSLVEVVFEYDADGQNKVEAERMQVGYTVNDAVTLWAGRFHTPIGLWNTLYHHGANLQTAISRPRFLQFEDFDGLVPTHTVGVWGSGKLPMGWGKLGYDVYLGNGPTIRQRELDFNAFTDDNSGKLLGANVGLQPNGVLRGLTVGAHAYGSTVDTRDAAGGLQARTRVRMAGAYLGYDADGWDVLGEYYRFANRDLASGAQHNSGIGYLQVGRSYGSLTPYLRYERAALAGADAYFASLRLGRSYTRASLGVRYDLDPKSALKVEFGDTTESAAMLFDENGAPLPLVRARYRRAAIQYSIAF